MASQGESAAASAAALPDVAAALPGAVSVPLAVAQAVAVETENTVRPAAR